MARDGLLSNVGLALGGFVALTFFGIVVFSYFQNFRHNATAAQPATAPQSNPGWAIRYNATRALAKRGSDHVKEKMDELNEMLDEEKQRRNQRIVLKGGKESINEVVAFEVISSTLKALVELNRRRPDIDLSPLHAAINKLAESSNPALRTLADHAKVELGIKTTTGE
jgi:hypothetical protein